MEKTIKTQHLFMLKSEEVKRMQVDRILYDQPQNGNPRLYAPIWELKKKMRIWGILSNNGKPKANETCFRYHEFLIIDYYKQKALRFLNYYKPAANFHYIKKLVNYHMR